ncbi:phage tail length tape measure family protein [Enterobacter hormaechei]
MRTLPAQFTDIATQLAGGQAPFPDPAATGPGRLKTSSVGSGGAVWRRRRHPQHGWHVLNPTTIALGGLIGTIGLLAAAAYNSSEQFDPLARSVIMMGGAGFASMQQLNEAAEEVAGKTKAHRSVPPSIRWLRERYWQIYRQPDEKADCNDHHPHGRPETIPKRQWPTSAKLSATRLKGWPASMSNMVSLMRP